MLYIKSLSTIDRLVKNTSWMMVTELLSKVSRIATVMSMAMFLAPVDYGIAALAIACHEIIRVFSRAGAGAKVIQCSDKNLQIYAENASLIQWLVCSLLAFAQIAIASPLANFYQTPELANPLVVMALTYLCYPLVAVKIFTLQRSNNFRYYSLGTAACVTLDNLAVIVFLALDQGVLAIAFGKIIAAIFWVIIFGLVKTPYFKPKYHAETFKQLCRYTLQVFTSDLMRSLRTNIDILIAGRFLSPEAFGFYSFAKNAGVGLSQSLVNAYCSGLYPYLCEKIRSGSGARAYVFALKLGALVSVVFGLQALAAPFYIDILFDSRWQDSAILVSVLCLTAIPSIIIDTTGLYYRALNHTLHEIYTMLACVVISVCFILFANPSSELSLAITMLVSSIFWLPLAFHLLINHKIFSIIAYKKVSS